MQRKERNEIAPVKTQVCPHGSSLPCSQCAGFVARKAKYDPIGGVMTIDGEAVRDGVEDSGVRDKASRGRTRRGYARTRRPSRCSACGKLGHTRQSKECLGPGATMKDAA